MHRTLYRKGLTLATGIAEIGTMKGTSTEGDADEPADHPIEMLTLVTLDLCHDGEGALVRDLAFEQAEVEFHLARCGQRAGEQHRLVETALAQAGGMERQGNDVLGVNFVPDP